MNVSIHFITSLILSFVLFPFFGYYSFLALIGGFLIDFDHYAEYVLWKKDFSLRRAYWFYKDKKDLKTIRLVIFHTIEFWILLLILSFYSKIVMIISIGVILHILLDFFNHLSPNRMPRSYSIIRWWIKRKKS